MHACKEMWGRIMVVLLTDGRANVSLAESNAGPEAVKEGAPRPSTDNLKKEASGMQLLVVAIDIVNKYVTTSFSAEIGNAAGGRYYYLPNANDKAIAAAASDAMAEV
ncbi:hypothetical protein WJX74_004190 [Apatococcus lobatus]|uniref:VWFA domain-containing protein n=1 Tax=Apatococcus lobatus TaxID=904363 RepID=A0AAW1RLJ5_9CHLO